MAHFHYTIMGGLIFAFMAGMLLLAAEDDGHEAERDGWARWQFWTMFIFFNSTFLPLFALGDGWTCRGGCSSTRGTWRR